MAILEDMADEGLWREFLEHKQSQGNISERESQAIAEFIEKRKNILTVELIEQGEFPKGYPKKSSINKGASSKKRVVYSYDEDDNIAFKFIAHRLHNYEDVFSKRLYSFRRGYGVGEAMNYIGRNRHLQKMYCYKADISNYFNSIDVDKLLDKLCFVKERDQYLYNIFYRMLKEDKVYEGDKLVSDSHGAMAGTPVSPFFANVYLTELDMCFEEMGVVYFRYSDDVLIFGKTLEELEKLQKMFEACINDHGLSLNPEKVTLTKPYEEWEFLGFSYNKMEIDLSQNTVRKIKAKIKRKADALRRWQRKKGLPEEKAAIGFINAMNRKFFGAKDDDEFTWCRWFFPYLTTSQRLHEVDEYMQQYIRYAYTGRHYKGNYRITYETLKKWGYRSLVNEFYRGRDI